MNSNIAIHKVIQSFLITALAVGFSLQDPSHFVARMAGYFVVQASYPWKGEVKGNTLWLQCVIVRSLLWLVRDLTYVREPPIAPASKPT
jgi:hypothetical protein